MKKTTLHIKGMHCPSCEILIKDKIRQIRGVGEVRADFRQQQAEVLYTGNFGPEEREKINSTIKPFGYEIVEKDEIKKASQPWLKKALDAGAIAILLFVGFYFSQELHLFPKFDITSGLTLTTVFLLGIIASTSTCMATSGTLLLTLVKKLKSSIGPSIFFNLGRVISYGFFGFVIGLLGKTISYNLQLNSILTAVVSVAMILVGLDMLQLISFSSLSLHVPGGFLEKIENKLMKNPRQSAILLGGLTFFMPCGFTQTIQLYVLGLADPVKSATVMFIFALGTAPVLLLIGFVSFFTNNNFFKFFQKVVAVLIVMIGINYFGNFLSLQGVSLNFAAGQAKQEQTISDNVVMENGVQVVRMDVDSSGYNPNDFTIKKNVPVRWLINGKDVYGCQGYFVVPSLGIQQSLKPGENKFEFTPRQSDTINFSCGMGMFKGSFKVI